MQKYGKRGDIYGKINHYEIPSSATPPSIGAFFVGLMWSYFVKNYYLYGLKIWV